MEEIKKETVSTVKISRSVKDRLIDIQKHNNLRNTDRTLDFIMDRYEGGSKPFENMTIAELISHKKELNEMIQKLMEE